MCHPHGEITFTPLSKDIYGDELSNQNRNNEPQINADERRLIARVAIKT